MKCSIALTRKSVGKTKTIKLMITKLFYKHELAILCQDPGILPGIFIDGSLYLA